MTVTEAHAVNVICRALLGPRVDPPTEDELVSALATLAEHANKRLMAGYTGGHVVARRNRLRLRLREPREGSGSKVDQAER